MNKTKSMIIVAFFLFIGFLVDSVMALGKNSGNVSIDPTTKDYGGNGFVDEVGNSLGFAEARQCAEQEREGFSWPLHGQIQIFKKASTKTPAPTSDVTPTPTPIITPALTSGVIPPAGGPNCVP